MERLRQKQKKEKERESEGGEKLSDKSRKIISEISEESTKSNVKPDKPKIEIWLHTLLSKFLAFKTEII